MRANIFTLRGVPLFLRDSEILYSRNRLLDGSNCFRPGEPVLSRSDDPSWRDSIDLPFFTFNTYWSEGGVSGRLHFLLWHQYCLHLSYDRQEGTTVPSRGVDRGRTQSPGACHWRGGVVCLSNVISCSGKGSRFEEGFDGPPGPKSKENPVEQGSLLWDRGKGPWK